MIRINWIEIKSLKTHLARLGFTKDSEVVLLVFFKGRTDSQNIKLRLGKLDNILFDMESNNQISSIFLFDSEIRKPLWKIKEVDDSYGIESIPVGGHSQIVRDYKDMDEESRDVWVDITIASMQRYLDKSGD